jgi:hypothetical protein
VIVFSGAFEMLFDIVRDEGAGNGGIVVIDCLHVIYNLLKDNPLTANHFRSPCFSFVLRFNECEVGKLGIGFLITVEIRGNVKGNSWT